jgi:TolB-like protein/Flp pilus assembly protein TadD
MAERSFFAELRKRKVIQSAAIYGAVAWGVTEVVVTIVEQLFLPQWVATLAVIFFVVGFPIAMFLSWTFDLTSEGIQRTTVTSRRGSASIALSMVLLIAGTAGLFLLIKPGLENRAPPEKVAMASPNSVAVLPFDYSGPNPDDNYLGAGLSDELRDQLGRVDGLRIAARSSSVAAVAEGTDAKAMALKLGVAHLLEGNMRRQGHVLRVSVQLIDGASGLAIWNETFDRGRTELLNVQQDIAQSVANALLPDSNPKITAPITTDATAHEKMLLARHYEQLAIERETVDRDLLKRSIQLYREAIELDANSALAHSRLAGALMFYGDIVSAEAPAFRALALNPNLAEVQNTLGKFLFALGRPNWGDAFARAVELNPNLPDALHDYAHWYWFNVAERGAGELYERALELDPLNISRYAALGSYLALNGEREAAYDVVNEMQRLFDSPSAYRAIAKVLDHVGDVDHAIAWTIRARDAEPDNELHVEQLAEYFIDIGDFDTATNLEPDLGVGLLFKMRRYDEMIDKAEELIFDYPEDIQLRVYLAAAYSFSGRPELAVRLIRSSGILDVVVNGWRTNEEFIAFTVLTDAAYAAGKIEEARDLSAWMGDTHYMGEAAYWWVSILIGCEKAILGDDAEVRRKLRLALEGDQLVWDPMLKDVACYQRFHDDPAYLAVVEHFNGRREMLRKRLPTTIAQYGVAL